MQILSQHTIIAFETLPCKSFYTSPQIILLMQILIQSFKNKNTPLVESCLFFDIRSSDRLIENFSFFFFFNFGLSISNRLFLIFFFFSLKTENRSLNLISFYSQPKQTAVRQLWKLPYFALIWKTISILTTSLTSVSP